MKLRMGYDSFDSSSDGPDQRNRLVKLRFFFLFFIFFYLFFNIFFFLRDFIFKKTLFEKIHVVSALPGCYHQFVITNHQNHKRVVFIHPQISYKKVIETVDLFIFSDHKLEQTSSKKKKKKKKKKLQHKKFWLTGVHEKMYISL